MFYTALISSYHCSNDDSIEKFISIEIYPNYMFLLILVSPVTGDPHGIQRVKMKYFYFYNTEYNTSIFYNTSIMLNFF